MFGRTLDANSHFAHLELLTARTLQPEDTPEHHRTGRVARRRVFYLRRRGYTIIAATTARRIIAANSIWWAGTATSCASSK